jgi:hypothetical protein
MRRILVSLAVVIAWVAGVSVLQAQGRGPAYNGYAHADCSPSKTPAVRLVLVTGPAPVGLPATPPRPSIQLLLYSPADQLAGKTITVDAAAAPSVGVALSCPVVGSCSRAETGTVTIQSRGGDGTLEGSFEANWPGGQPRAGRFSVDWRDAAPNCS